MIRSIESEAELILAGQRSRKLPPDMQQTARRKLRILNRVKSPLELRVPPGNRLEELKGERKGTYSVRINDQWRITFRWVDGGADDVRIEDYHRG
ncbi:type II toxin-antitoxin system RelE/ParE family toxin [uncultured Sphingomonas sp.]|uniref:type II toxin-antitoxin system RelE/ParE family toxin n=1 Tax=uncultured Sphingomonas sp. TaxID=158754 RepID=UPI0025E8A4D6|nr:type II toxin-antitoxin system RelE/ParE family toxin [uncultured Sphingomonas sp.]